MAPHRPIARFAVGLVAVALLTAACGDDDGDGTPPDPTITETTTTAATTTEGPATTSTTTEAPTTSSVDTTTTSITTTTAPEPVCVEADAVAILDAAVADARLATGAAWSTDPAEVDASPFADGMTTGAEYASRLGLDCGVVARQTTDARAERLAIIAWTGPRAGFVIRATDGPSPPYSPDATVRTQIDDVLGEYLRDGMTLWGTTFPDEGTFVTGVIDYSLGAAAKDWIDDDREPPEPEISLDSEAHAVDTLREAGMRNVDIAQPHELGSEEGTVQFISPSGQISVADVAPTGWFDPMVPRYFTGETRIETIDGVDVRITAPEPDDNLGFTIGAEVAFACDGFVWILEPPFNGTVDEMLATATAVVGTEECRAG